MWVVSVPPPGCDTGSFQALLHHPRLASSVLLGFVLCKHGARAVQLVTLHEQRMKVMMVKP